MNREAALVRVARHPQNSLEHLLVLHPNSTYSAFFSLHREKTLFGSINTELVLRENYEKAFAHRKDQCFQASTATPRLLYAAFLLFHHITQISRREDKDTFIFNLPLEI